MNDTCSNSTINPRVELFQLIMYTPTFILGLLFNVMALSFLFFPAKKLTESTVYLVALIFLDTLLLFTLPFKIVSYHQNNWKLGSIFCSILESLYFINMYSSILISLCICVDRYIAIQHPFIAPTLRSTKKAALVCAAICLGTSTGTIATAKFHEESYNNISSCFYNFSKSTWENTGLIISLETIFFGSMVAMAFCTIQIVRCLRNHRKAENLQTHTTRAEKVVVTNFVTFLVCFTPYHVMFFLYFLVRNSIMHIPCHTVLRDILQVTLCWANLNCCLDGVCYYFVLKESAEGSLQNKVRNHPEESFDSHMEH